MAHADLATPALSVGHDVLLGEIRGLYGAERQFLQALGMIAQAVQLSRVKHAVVALVTATGGRLWRLEEIFVLLQEDVAGRHSPGLLRIVESRWTQQCHRLQHSLLELHVVGTTLQESASHLAVLYAVAERRARELGLADIASHLAAAHDDAEAMALMVATHTGVHPAATARRRGFSPA